MRKKKQSTNRSVSWGNRIALALIVVLLAGLLLFTITPGPAAAGDASLRVDETTMPMPEPLEVPVSPGGLETPLVSWNS